jgi:hypothetical protein
MATTTETIGFVGFGVLTLSGLVLVAGLLFRIEQQLKWQGTALWVDSTAVEHNCFANRDAVTCTFTNKAAMAVTTCVEGVLTPKSGPSNTLKSITICTGKLERLETKTVTGPWDGSFADEICYRDGQFGKQMDWSKCNFVTSGVNLAAIIPPPS